METSCGRSTGLFLSFLPRRAASVWALGVFVFHFVAGAFQIVEYLNLAPHLRSFPSPGESVERTGKKNKQSKQGLPTYWEMLPLVIFNQVVMLFPLMLFLEWNGLAFIWSCRFSTLGNELTAIVAMAVGHDILFYIFHRFLLHSEYFRFLRHDVHHTSKAHSGVSAMYMHPFDFVLEIALPYLVPLVAVTAYLNTVIVPPLSLAAGCIGGIVEHSGFNLTGFRVDTATHLMHHRRGYCSFSDGFGSPGMMDSVFGTSCVSVVPSISTVLEECQRMLCNIRSTVEKKE